VLFIVLDQTRKKNKKNWAAQDLGQEVGRGSRKKRIGGTQKEEAVQKEPTSRAVRQKGHIAEIKFGPAVTLANSGRPSITSPPRRENGHVVIGVVPLHASKVSPRPHSHRDQR